MAWFLALQGPTHVTNQSLIYQLADSADVDKIAQELSSAATLDRAVPIPAVFANHQKTVQLYVRPAAWGAWTFYEMSDDERRNLPTGNPLIDAIAQAAKEQQEQQAKNLPQQ
jgi:hypothetical protein